MFIYWVFDGVWFLSMVLIRLSKRILFLERNCLSNLCIRGKSHYFETMGKTVEETYKKVTDFFTDKMLENDFLD